MSEVVTSKTNEVMRVIKDRIANRAYAVGDRLPSIRSVAKSMNVSPSTVVEAYDQLAAEGSVRARRGSGFYIASSPLPALVLSGDDPMRDRSVDPFWVSRQSLDSDPAVLKPGCGWLPTDWLPTDALRRAVRALSRADRVCSDSVW